MHEQSAGHGSSWATGSNRASHPEAGLVAGQEVVDGGPVGGAAHVVPQHVVQRQLFRDQLRVRRVADAPAACRKVLLADSRTKYQINWCLQDFS